MPKYEIEDPRGALNALEEMFPSSTRKGLRLVEALRGIDMDARRVAANAKRYGVEHMRRRLHELGEDMRGLLGREECERLGVCIAFRMNSSTIMMPQELMPEQNHMLFSEYIDDEFNQWFLLV